MRGIWCVAWVDNPTEAMIRAVLRYALLLCLAVACSPGALRADASDASRDIGGQDAGDAPPATNTDADMSGRIQFTASQCSPGFCPSERCLSSESMMTCNPLACPAFTAYQCPIDCVLAVGCDGEPACLFSEPSCGG